jgi:hypothetical protein
VYSRADFDHRCWRRAELGVAIVACGQKRMLQSWKLAMTIFYMFRCPIERAYAVLRLRRFSFAGGDMPDATLLSEHLSSARTRITLSRTHVYSK